MKAVIERYLKCTLGTYQEPGSSDRTNDIIANDYEIVWGISFGETECSIYYGFLLYSMVFPFCEASFWKTNYIYILYTLIYYVSVRIYIHKNAYIYVYIMFACVYHLSKKTGKMLNRPAPKLGISYTLLFRWFEATFHLRSFHPNKQLLLYRCCDWVTIEGSGATTCD